MTTELRCPHFMHGKIVNGLLEIKCQKAYCGAGRGVVVFHYWDFLTGELVSTKKYRDAGVLLDSKVKELT